MGKRDEISLVPMGWRPPRRMKMVAVDLRATVPKATLTDRRPEVDGYLPRLFMGK